MRKIRMNRSSRSSRRGPGRKGSLRTDFSEDYDTTDFAHESEDNWDNEGGTFANPDSDYDDDFEEGYDEEVEQEFEDDWDDEEEDDKIIRRSGKTRPGTASRVRHTGVSISKNRNRNGKRSGKKNFDSGLDERVRYDW